VVFLFGHQQKTWPPKCSAQLLIKTLENAGYLKSGMSNGKFSFGLKLVSLSKMALENLDLRKQVRPLLQDLMLLTGLTVHMAILEKAEAVIIEKIEAPGMLRVATWGGKRLDANCSGVGKVLLTFAAEENSDSRITSLPMARNNKNTIASPERMACELKKVRESRFAFEDEEGEIGFRCIAAPISDSTKHVVAAISIAGATSQILDDRVSKLTALVKAAAGRISAELGNSSDLARADGRLKRPRKLR
jgi:DNA-binding IclR family transcriptional regulator